MDTYTSITEGSTEYDTLKTRFDDAFDAHEGAVRAKKDAYFGKAIARFRVLRMTEGKHKSVALVSKKQAIAGFRDLALHYLRKALRTVEKRQRAQREERRATRTQTAAQTRRNEDEDMVEHVSQPSRRRRRRNKNPVHPADNPMDLCAEAPQTQAPAKTATRLPNFLMSFEEFVASSDVVLGSERYCLYDDFKHAWKAFSISNGYSHGLFMVPARTPFAKFGLRLETGTQRTYRGITSFGTWVVGADLPPASTASTEIEFLQSFLKLNTSINELVTQRMHVVQPAA